ncbi:ADP-ribosylation factor GTPase-activating protein AGD12 [Hibiscus syriacus]|uniref:ADP-ribosylation factor GTPase-activating protein AGD12 n=1 Tax=Hibiscus syriacus TaxID=106335 RepID=A0A6A2X9E3_HIBSY|nr:ADP-ribosylation factor GTPase-activating protein AGD12 [Hibiscus syriacus]
MSGVKRTTSAKVRLRSLLNQTDNRTCADCSLEIQSGPNIGVFLCLKCCGVHRSLGPHISKVLSVTLDEWSDEEIEAMIEVGGNSAANSIYEAYITEGYKKPGPNASNDERSRFIKLDFRQFTISQFEYFFLTYIRCCMCSKTIFHLPAFCGYTLLG